MADISIADLRAIFTDMKIVVTGPDLAITYDLDDGHEIRLAQVVAEVEICGQVFGRSIASSPSLLDADARPDVIANLRKSAQVLLRHQLAVDLGIMLTQEQMEAL